MKTEAVKLFDAFRGEWAMEKAESLWLTLEGLAKKAVREETDERIADRVDVQVEKAMFREMKDVATKGDLTKLEAKMDKLDGKVDGMFRWMATGFIAILLAIVAMMAATRPAGASPVPPTSVSPTSSPNP